MRDWVIRAEEIFEAAWSFRQGTSTVPFVINAIDDAASRQEARVLFHQGNYVRAAKLLSDVGTREKLSPAEEKMLELALKRNDSKLE